MRLLHAALLFGTSHVHSCIGSGFWKKPDWDGLIDSSKQSSEQAAGNFRSINAMTTNEFTSLVGQIQGWLPKTPK